MGTKDTRSAHGAVGKTDMLLFDPESMGVINDPSHPLYDARANEEPTEAFIENLMVHGVIEPVVFRKDGETGGPIVEDGRKRTLGLREANRRLKKKGVSASELWRLPAIPKRGSDADAILRMLMLNEQRFVDTPSNKARKAAAALDRGKTEDEVCVALGVTKSTLKNLLAYIDAPAVVRNAGDAGKITMSDAYKLAKLPVEEAREKVAKLIEHAPRVPGRKRSRNAGKAREIMGDKKRTNGALSNGASHDIDIVRGRNQIENVAREIEQGDRLGTQAKAAIGALVRWLLGEDKALGELGL